MDKCPECSHWNMSYNSAQQAWVCGCHTWLPKKYDYCQCLYVIPETQESWNKRLLAQNQLGRFSVEPPSVNQKEKTKL